MGRTVPTFRLLLESTISGWGQYKRALRSKDKEVFDDLMNKARAHASACSYANRIDPMESIFMSIILELQKEIEALKERVRSTEK
ncbi:MAG: hypothetical protein ACE5IJ_00510 [Thermoplasmata archaeon]